MLSIIIVLSLFFGLSGFLVGLVLAVIVSGLHSSYEKARIEKQRHKEMLNATIALSLIHISEPTRPY